MDLDIGQLSFLSIIVHLISIFFSWIALQSLNFEKFLRPNHIFQARLLYILLAIALGSIVGNFMLDYLYWAQRLPQIFS